MGLFKSKGERTVRINESLIPLMDRLKQALEHAEIDGGKVNPDLRDEDVIGFAIRAASVMLTPRYAVVDRDQYARRVDRELVVGIPNFTGWPEDQRLACLDLILARSAEFSGFHSTSPLMAAPPAGEKPS